MTAEAEDIETVSVSFIGGPWDGRTRTLYFRPGMILACLDPKETPRFGDGIDWASRPVAIIKYRIDFDPFFADFVGRVCG